MKNYFFVSLLFTLVLTSCIDPITLSQAEEVNVLVIEGGITTEYGPHTIKLTRSAQYGDIFVGQIQNELGAKLFIRDEFGNTIVLVENGAGVYSTPNNFKGEIGRNYTLIVRTKEGVEYQSYPELLSKVTDINNVSIDYVDIPIRKEELGNTFISGVEVYVSFKDPVETRNYYKWQTSGTYGYITYPQLFKVFNPRTGKKDPAPKECCELCFTYENNIGISISSDRLYNGNIYESKIYFIEDDGLRFSSKYIIHIDQLSISKEAYQYFELLKNQLTISGNIFDPPPATIRGNIIGITNPDEAVVGYFTASDIVSVEYHIYGNELPRLVARIVPDDCRVIRNGTTIIPDNW